MGNLKSLVLLCNTSDVRPIISLIIPIYADVIKGFTNWWTEQDMFWAMFFVKKISKVEQKNPRLTSG